MPATDKTSAGTSRSAGEQPVLRETELREQRAHSLQRALRAAEDAGNTRVVFALLAIMVTVLAISWVGMDPWAFVMFMSIAVLAFQHGMSFMRRRALRAFSTHPMLEDP